MNTTVRTTARAAAPRHTRTRAPILLLILMFILGIFVARLPATVALFRGPTAFMTPIQEVFDRLAAEYVDPLEPDRITELQTGAIQGMLAALDDPYAEYIPAADHDEFMKLLSGTFVGIGASVTKNPDDPFLTLSADGLDDRPAPSDWRSDEKRTPLVIVEPMDDSPALRAGLRPGDRVMAIDGTSTLPLTVDECIELIAGEPGAPVTLQVSRGETPDAFPIQVERAEITSHPVRGVERRSASDPAAKPDAWEFLIDHERRIAYLRLDEFLPNASNELRDVLRGLLETGPLGGLVLDLRGNPGGDLDACLAAADLFLKDGIIISVRGRDSKNKQIFEASNDGDTLPDFPMMILVNGDSASASEILAGSLAENGRAVILGTRTFGKGVVQSVQPLDCDADATIKFTQERYFLPTGRSLHRDPDSTIWGVDPSPGFYVPITTREQVRAAIRRHELDQPLGALTLSEIRPVWRDPADIETKTFDIQLAAALRSMQHRIETGAWTPIGDAAQQAERIQAAELKSLSRQAEFLAVELNRVQQRMAALGGDSSVKIADGDRPDLWPDEAPIRGGRIEIFSPDGERLQTLGITNRYIEVWLQDAGLRPLADVPSTATQPGAP